MASMANNAKTVCNRFFPAKMNTETRMHNHNVSYKALILTHVNIFGIFQV